MPDDLADNVDIAAQILDDIVRGNVIKPSSKRLEPLLKFIIARKWNSWYPCYFNTQGGCYAFATRDSEKDPKENKGVILIDPGIKFSENLREIYNIEPHDIRKVIVSHYHPDHTMGLYELLTLTHESQYPCSYYLNETSYESFKPFQGKYNKVIELSRDQIIRIAEYDYLPEVRKGYYSEDAEYHDLIYMKPIKTFHAEVGNRNNCLGFSFYIYSYKNKKINSKYELTILGDTDGNEAYLPKYLDYLKNSDIAILHLGSFSEKGFGEGNKHLYKIGLINILNCIFCKRGGKIPRKEGKILDCIERDVIKEKNNGIMEFTGRGSCPIRESDYFNNLKLIIISEIGLEMAPLEEMITSFDNFKWLTKLYPIILLYKFSGFFEDSYVQILKGNSKGLQLFRSLLASKGAESISDLLNRNLMEDEIISTHNFSIFLSFIFYHQLSQKISDEAWIQLFSPRAAIDKFRNYPNDESQIQCSSINAHEMIELKMKEAKKRAESATLKEKNKALFEHFKDIDCSSYLKDSFSFQEFLRDFKYKINNLSPYELTSGIADDVSKFVDIFIEGAIIKDASRTDIIDLLINFSEKLFYAAKDSNKFYSKRMINNFQSYYSFIGNMSLSDSFNNTCSFLRERYEIHPKDIYPIIYLVIYQLCSQATNKKIINKSQYSISRNNSNDDRRSLIEILANIFWDYELDNLKVFLGDLGMEIDLSSKELRIKSRNSSWVPVNLSKQRIIDGKIEIIKGK